MLERIIQTLTTAQAALSFGVQNSPVTKVLEGTPFTADEFLEKGGDISENANPKSLRGSSNLSITTVT